MTTRAGDGRRRRTGCGARGTSRGGDGARVARIEGTDHGAEVREDARFESVGATLDQSADVERGENAGKSRGSEDAARRRERGGATRGFRRHGYGKYLGLDETLLCCFIALEKKKGKSSSWYDYVSKLPTLDDFLSRVPAVMSIRAHRVCWDTKIVRMRPRVSRRATQICVGY